MGSSEGFYIEEKEWRESNSVFVCVYLCGGSLFMYVLYLFKIAKDAACLNSTIRFAGRSFSHKKQVNSSQHKEKLEIRNVVAMGTVSC